MNLICKQANRHRDFPNTKKNKNKVNLPSLHIKQNEMNMKWSFKFRDHQQNKDFAKIAFPLLEKEPSTIKHAIFPFAFLFSKSSRDSSIIELPRTFIISCTKKAFFYHSDRPDANDQTTAIDNLHFAKCVPKWYIFGKT